MSRFIQDKTHKSLLLLVGLFLVSIFIIVTLNYVFEFMIKELNQQTRNLETKKLVENKVSNLLVSARENISDFMVLSPTTENQEYFKNKINDKITQIKYNVHILEKGSKFKLDNTLQVYEYKPIVYNQDNARATKVILEDIQQCVELFFLSLDEFSKKIIIDKVAYIAELNYLIKEMKNSNIKILKQTNLELAKITKAIAIKTQHYVQYKLIAIALVIISLLFGSRILSKQILVNSKEAEKMALKANLANQAKSDFLANMSHEIRTPLNAILGFIDILKENETDSKRLGYFQTVQSSSKSLLGIINDILDFSKIESGNLQIDKVNFNTYAEFNTIANLFRAKAIEEKVKLTVNINQDMPSALVSDPLRIKQVMANLLSNAIKFTNKDNGSVVFTIQYANNHLQVSVKDNGIGIASDKQEAIFQAFSQAESSTTRQYGGTGLGLTISSKLISILGGELKLKSKLGIGSVFYFSIPVEAGQYKNDDVKKVIDSDTLKGKYILLVEDNKANQMFMSLILKKFNVKFDIANNGQEALEAYANKTYDLILMDENMPILNGIEATQRILKIEKDKNIAHTPIIALTANALKGDREKFLEAGLDEYLTKPVNKEKLFSMMTKFLTTNKKEAVLV